MAWGSSALRAMWALLTTLTTLTTLTKRAMASVVARWTWRARASHPSWLVGLAVVLWAGAAAAHKVGLSRGEYTVRRATVVAEMVFERAELAQVAPAADLDGDGALGGRELEAGRAAIEKELVGRVRVEGDGAGCPGSLVDVRPVEADGVMVAALYVCPAPPSRVSITFDLFEQLAHGHRHLATVIAGDRLAEAIAFSTQRTFSIDAPPGEGGSAAAKPSGNTGSSGNQTTAGALFWLGVEHILTGVDHLVFLLGLVIVGGRARSIVGVVTAFTVAHSISLAVAALGWWAPSPRVVEPAIALSIAYVGVENFFVKDASRRWRVTFPFGLVHGFGFAGGLLEIGLPRAKVPMALFLFNAGVEVGQLAVLAVVLPLVFRASRSAWFQRYGVRGVSAAIVVAGVGWFVERAFFAG
jgi:hydrogenase/urease accessory protein HupE